MPGWLEVKLEPDDEWLDEAVCQIVRAARATVGATGEVTFDPASSLGEAKDVLRRLIIHRLTAATPQ